MAEWSKAHAWKVCIRQKRIEGSNPFLSANIYFDKYTYINLLNKLKYLGLSITSFAILFKLMSWQYAQYLLIAGLSFLGIYFMIRVFK